MKCAKCNAGVSIADSRCPKCGQDLLQLWSTVSGEPENKSLSIGIPDILKKTIASSRDEMQKSTAHFDLLEKSVFQPIEGQLQRLFDRYLTDEELDAIFNNEIPPIIDQIDKDKSAEKTIQIVRDKIRKNLGDEIFRYYENKCPEIITMLFSGEMVCLLLKADDIDLSVKMFEFFKATEVASAMHSENRLNLLIKDPAVVVVADIIDNNTGNIYSKDIPQWLDGNKKEEIEGHKGALLGLLKLLLADNPSMRKLCNSRNAGLALHIFGRESIEIKGTKVSINNIFDAKGSMIDREKLARDLCEIQAMRNKKIHEDIAELERDVETWKSTAYDCLKAMPMILKIVE